MLQQRYLKIDLMDQLMETPWDANLISVSYDVLVRDSLSFVRAMDACLADGMIVC